MIRPSIIESIRTQLDLAPVLVPEDFYISTSAEPNKQGTTLSVEYLGGDAFFKAGIPPSKSKLESEYSPDFTISIRVNPGELSLTETLTVRGTDSLLDAIGKWALRLQVDLEKAGSHRRLKDHEERVKSLEEQLEDIPNTYATAEQATKMQEWLSNVETELRERIQALEVDSKEKERRISELHQSLEIMRGRAKSTHMRGWFRSTFARILRVATDPRFEQLLDNGTKLAGLLQGIPQ